MASFDLATVTRGVRALQVLDVSRIVGLLRGIPTALKYLVMFVFLLNIKSWPLGWHFRIWRPALLRQFQHRMLKLRTMFYSKEKQIRLEDEWYNSITPIGAHPLEKEVSYRAWASLDESDFNGHLSNSSYAKTLDAVRFKAAIVYFPNLFRERGWIPLAATHFHFIREIPILAPYEIRSRIVAWDQKWFYIVHRFVTKPKKNAKKQIAATPTATVSRTAVGPEELSGNGTPVTSASTNSEGRSSSPCRTSSRPRSTTARLCIPSSAQQLCFKVGRITIPPELIFAINGFSGVPGDEAKPFTATNPPPHWETVEAMALKSLGKGGGRRPMADFLEGWLEGRAGGEEVVDPSLRPDSREAQRQPRSGRSVEEGLGRREAF
ncbi:hypothetical protein FA13DRAFT_960169 [Coprinellus micaceus]|uniref:Thioesterase/thiol ester dehydrase-isomerase n=1 Tax=Coprinellus micaceus TaxID=71717 RepID=A0A4Y7SZ50_COPMI|nr:hypothetical protein FA13DRAFT_960169 [Coprinellus micaceus]